MSLPARKNAWYGCRRDTRDARDHEFHPTAVRIPAAVDLRSHCPPVMDQGELGSCTAHGITGALRYDLISSGKPDIPLSRLQLYFDERFIEGTVNDDAGAEIRDGIKSAAKLGVGRETLWPYRINQFKKKPPAACYRDAVRFEALSYQRVQVSVSALKAAIAAGHPVVIGISVYSSFESDAVAKTGIVPMPDLHREQLLGGHCLYAVAYRKGFITARNSWGPRFGDGGDVHFPEAYLGSPKLGSDYWAITTAGHG
jgi:C1A family cysteine protease